MIGCILLLLALVVPITSGNEQYTADDMWGKPIRYIRIESPAASATLEVPYAIHLKEGDILTREGVRACLRRINLLKRFNSAEAYAEPFEDGCALIFRLKPDWVIRSLDFSSGTINFLFRYGLISRFSPKSLQKQIAIQRGDVYSSKSSLATVQSLKDFYFNNGYAQAVVELIPKFDQKSASVDIVFNIRQGNPTRIRNITVEGNGSIRTETLIRKSGIARNRKFLRKEVNDARVKLENYYKRQGFLNVQVIRPTIQYDRDTNTISVKLKVIENDSVDIKIKTEWHSWNILWWFYFLENRMDLYLEILGIEESGRIDRNRFLEGVKNLEKQFWNHGFLNAAVNLTEIQDEPGDISYRFEINEKEPVKVSDLTIEGNVYFSVDELFSNNLIGTEVGQRFHYDTFIADGEDLKNFYLAKGFHDIDVKTEHSSADNSKTVSIRFLINEGTRYLWSSVSMEGNTAFSESEILDILAVSPSSPYHFEIIDAGIDKLIDHYMEKGYPDVSVSWDLIDENSTNPSLHLEIHEGIAAVIETVLINGYSRTLRSVIERNLPNLQGEPFSFRTILNAERQLIRTNLFKSVEIVSPSWETGSRNRTLVINVKEQPFAFLEGGPGYNSDRGFNGYLSLYTTNLGGSNRYLGISGSMSEKDYKSNIIFREPEFANLPVQLELRLLTEQTTEPDYRLVRRGTRATWSYRVRESLRLLLVYRFDNDEPYDISSEAEIPEDYRNSVKIGSLSPGFLYDSRDDPRAPHSGSLFSSKFEFARNMYSSEVQFTKISTEATHFIGLKKNGVLGISLRSGLGYRLPFQEEFRLGGIKSIRGWDYESIRKTPQDSSDTISVPDDSDIDLSLLFNLEYRHPLVWGLEGVIFFDCGNVFNDYSDTAISELKGTAGLGVRFMTPVGPIGVDYGYNVMRTEEDDPRERWSFVIGHTF